MGKLTMDFLRGFYNGERDVFVETGTFAGASLSNMSSSFNELHSIEASERYYREAVSKFRGHSSITIHKGNSAEVLPSVLEGLRKRHIVFWLDAHWIADLKMTDDVDPDYVCPIMKELKAIKEARLEADPVILIDDLRLFGGDTKGFPHLDKVKEVILDIKGVAEFHLENDIIIAV